MLTTACGVPLPTEAALIGVRIIGLSGTGSARWSEHPPHNEALMMTFDFSRLTTSSRARYRCSLFWLTYITTVAIIAMQPNEVSAEISRQWILTALVFAFSGEHFKDRIGLSSALWMLVRVAATSSAVLLQWAVASVFQPRDGLSSPGSVIAASAVILAALIFGLWRATGVIERDPPSTDRA